jgi:hypothetical protein
VTSFLFWPVWHAALAKENAGLATGGSRIGGEMRDHNEGKGGVGCLSGDEPCQYCRTTGVVSGAVGDVEFFFRCPCSGGNEEAVRWLLDLDSKTPPGEDWVI